MTERDYNINKNIWLQEVSDECHKFALKNDLDFYVFQTPIDKYNPDLLIIGINPGGRSSYSSILKKRGQDRRSPSDLAYDVNTLTTKPQWEIDEKEKGNDVMRSRFQSVFTEENNLKGILSNTVMMNMFYFNTSKESDLTSVDSDAKAYCLKKTIEFIEIINPKNILFLTSKNASLRLCTVNEIQLLGSNVKAGRLNGRKVYAIPHYGYYAAYSKIKSAEMGAMLGKLLNQ